MVRKVISTEVTVNQNIILSVLKKALTYIGDRERLVVRVSPDDFETFPAGRISGFLLRRALKT